jgi:hypothetical protein
MASAVYSDSLNLVRDSLSSCTMGLLSRITVATSQHQTLARHATGSQLKAVAQITNATERVTDVLIRSLSGPIVAC